jgi:aspartate/methionine/tyrosine aminotransferase
VGSASTLDPITATFGAFAAPEPAGLDVSLGALRGVPALDDLWRECSLGPELAAAVRDYPGTQGPESLLQLLSELGRRERGTWIEPDHLIATHGALHGLQVALAALPAGAPVLFPQPAFGYPSVIEAAGATPAPVAWPLGSPFGELLDALDAGLAAARPPAGVIVCLPANPSGASPTDAEWRALRALVAARGALLVVDDLYRFAEPRPFDVSGDDVIVVDSLSKRLGAPGLRFGWVGTTGPRWATLRAAAARTSVGVGQPSAALALAALRRYLADPGIAEQIRTALDARRREVRAAVPAALTAALVLTDAGFYASLRIEGADELALVASLRRGGIAVAPGSSLFAPPAPSHPRFVRFCLGSDPRVGEAVAATVAALTPELRSAA